MDDSFYKTIKKKIHGIVDTSNYRYNSILINDFDDFSFPLMSNY